MIKTVILFLFLFASTIFVNAQTTDSLIGKWKFKDVYNAENLDSTKVAMVRKMFANMTLYLKANKHYTAFFIAKEEGSWKYDEATKKIIMAANKGTENQMGVLAVTGQTIVLNIGKGKSMIMERAIPGEPDEAEEITYNGPLVSVTKEQICKKWYIVKREKPGQTEEILKTTMDLIKGAYYEFKTNQTYAAEVLNIKDEGSWLFEEGNKSIITISGKEKKFWHIKSVNDTELVLVRGNSNEFWTLSLKP